MKRTFFTTESTESTEEIRRDPFTEKVIGCAIAVHRTLGPGLLESTYQRCLAYEPLAKLWVDERPSHFETIFGME